jgi:hypothetical protein
MNLPNLILSSIFACVHHCALEMQSIAGHHHPS